MYADHCGDYLADLKKKKKSAKKLIYMAVMAMNSVENP